MLVGAGLLVPAGWAALGTASPVGATTDCGAPTVVGTTATVTCSYTGTATTWTVPAGVTLITVDASGGQGGSSGFGGGLGAQLTASLAVTPLENLNVLVGGQGGDGFEFSAGSGGGGTFVYTSPDQVGILVVAGGGGGAASNNGGIAATPTSTTGGTGAFTGAPAARTHPVEERPTAEEEAVVWPATDRRSVAQEAAAAVRWPMEGPVAQGAPTVTRVGTVASVEAAAGGP